MYLLKYITKLYLAGIPLRYIVTPDKHTFTNHNIEKSPCFKSNVSNWHLRSCVFMTKCAMGYYHIYKKAFFIFIFIFLFVCLMERID